MLVRLVRYGYNCSGGAVNYKTEVLCECFFCQLTSPQVVGHGFFRA